MRKLLCVLLRRGADPVIGIPPKDVHDASPLEHAEYALFARQAERQNLIVSELQCIKAFRASVESFVTGM
jgi:hypothetical protein